MFRRYLALVVRCVLQDEDLDGSLAEFIDDGTPSQQDRAAPPLLSSSLSDLPLRRSARGAAGVERRGMHPMPLLSRLMQAMKDGVTADDFADDDEEDVIEVDGDEVDSEEEEEEEGSGSDSAGGVRYGTRAVKYSGDSDGDDFQ